MQSQLVFQEKNEIKRLRVQNELLACYEAPVFAQIFSEGQDLAVLDIGCNDGAKTIERFTSDQVLCVIGLEYNEVLAAKAQKAYGNERFSFYPLDVEAEDFAERLRIIMNDKKIDGFDVIYLSFVLMHLSDVKGLLIALRPFLKTDGKLFIIEANDASSTLTGDKNGLLGEFLEILKRTNIPAIARSERPFAKHSPLADMKALTFGTMLFRRQRARRKRKKRSLLPFLPIYARTCYCFLSQSRTTKNTNRGRLGLPKTMNRSSA